jgi:hypothetical protein
MDCRLIQGDLVAYHFATTTDEARERIDAHLVACTGCLRAYLRVKHHIERSAGSEGAGDRPGAAMRQRLRADVAAAFRPTAKQRVQRALARPIPLYQGLVAAAVALLLAGAAPTVVERLVTGARDRGAEATNAERIDTSRASAESLTFY